MKSIGENIAVLRKNRGMTQEAPAMLYATLAFADECARNRGHFYNYYGCPVEELMG